MSALSDFVLYLAQWYPGGTPTYWLNRSGSLPRALQDHINIGLLDRVSDDHSFILVDLTIRRWLPLGHTIDEVAYRFPKLPPIVDNDSIRAALDAFKDSDAAIYRHASMPQNFAFNEAWDAVKALADTNLKYALYKCGSLLGLSCGQYALRDASNCVVAMLKGDDPHALRFDRKPSYESY